MLVTVGKLRGKRLVRAAVTEIKERGYAEIGAVSVNGIYRLGLAGQRIANELGVKISSDPREAQITLPDGQVVMGIVTRFTPSRLVGRTV